MRGQELHLVIPGSPEERTGGYIYDARMVEGLRRRGWSVAVLSLGGELPFGDPRAGSRLAEALTRLRDGAVVVIDGLALAGLVDVIRAHEHRLTLLALVHLVQGDEPGLDPASRELRHELEREALAAMAGAIVTSDFTARRLREIGVEGARVRTVWPGTDRVAPATGPGPGAPPRLLCVAAVTSGKGQDVLVRALAELADAVWTCVCAGSLTRDAAYARRVLSMVREVGMLDRIELVGERDAATIEALYRTSSLFVLPSRYEAYGMALSEAMAHGLPIVSTTAGAIPDTVPAGTGLLVPPGDDAALADALRSLLVDDAGDPGSAGARRERLGTAARRVAAGRPDWEQAAEAFAAAILGLGGGMWRHPAPPVARSPTPRWASPGRAPRRRP